MAWHVLLSDEVKTTLAERIPEHFQPQVIGEFDELSLDPPNRGRKIVTPPYAPVIGGHVYEFHIDEEPERYEFVAFFVYTDNPEEIYVWELGMRPKYRPPSKPR